MKDQVCTQEQMQTLIDKGVDVSGASYKIIDPNTNPLLSRIDMIPVFTTADLMEMIPNEIYCDDNPNYSLVIERDDTTWSICYKNDWGMIQEDLQEHLPTLLYDTIIWLLDNEHKLNQ